MWIFHFNCECSNHTVVTCTFSIQCTDGVCCWLYTSHSSLSIVGVDFSFKQLVLIVLTLGGSQSSPSIAISVKNNMGVSLKPQGLILCEVIFVKLEKIREWKNRINTVTHLQVFGWCLNTVVSITNLQKFKTVISQLVGHDPGVTREPKKFLPSHSSEQIKANQLLYLAHIQRSNLQGSGVGPEKLVGGLVYILQRLYHHSSNSMICAIHFWTICHSCVFQHLPPKELRRQFQKEKKKKEFLQLWECGSNESRWACHD